MNIKTKFNKVVLVLCAFLFVQIGYSGQTIRDDDKMSIEKVGYMEKELAEKLIHTEGGIWVQKGFQNGIHYNYVLQFSKNYSATFSYLVRESEQGPWDRYVLRYGTFETNGNILTINFTSIKGRDYNNTKISDEPILEILCIEIEVEEIAESRITVKEHRGKRFYFDNPDYVNQDIEITEYTLRIKQIFGKNLFEIHHENMTIELVAERPIID